MTFWFLGGVALAGCGTDELPGSSANTTSESSAKPSAVATSSSASHGSSTVSDQAATARLWARSCALCHADGNAGAPRLGNSAEWSERLAKGPDALLDSTLNGLGQMPPLGYCMACERDDFVALIEFMTTGMAAEEPQS